MYARRFKCKSKNWDSFIQPYKCIIRSVQREVTHPRSSCQTSLYGDKLCRGSLIRKVLPDSVQSLGVATLDSRVIGRFNTCWAHSSVRFYCSKGDGSNASEDKHVPIKDATNVDKGKARKEKVGADIKNSNAHARLGEQDQKDWLNNEKLSIESKNKDSPFLSRRERFKKEFLRKVVPWEKITVSWETFPYYINEHTKNLLVECATSHLKHKKFARSFGARLNSSSGRILLQGIPGTELYCERLIRALARDLQVPLLMLDGSAFGPYDFGEQCDTESESDDDDAESGEDSNTDSEIEDENENENENENESNDEESASSSEVKSDSEDDAVDVRASAEALKKLVPFSLDEFGKRVSGESESTSESVKSETAQSQEEPKRPFQKGDRVKYVGASVRIEAEDRIVFGKIPTSDGPTSAYTIIRSRPLPSGQRGEVYEVNGDRVAVILDNVEKKTEGEADGKTAEEAAKSPVYWIHIQDIEHDLDAEAENWYIAMEALCEVLPSLEPIIVYFPDSSQLLSRAVPKSHRKEFVRKVEEMFERLSGPVVLICGQNKVGTTGSKEKGKLTMILPALGRLAKLPSSLDRLAEGLKATKKPEHNEIQKLFTNVVPIHLPKEDELLRVFNKQVEEDRKIVISRSNLNELQKVIDDHELSCVDLLHVNTDGVILTKQKAEKVVGWARNHYLSICLLPSIKGERLNVPRESLEVAILRLKEQDMISLQPSQILKCLAKDEFESNFVSAVVPPGDVGVKFDDIGALEDVKRTLDELVILPMRRPELFSRGNLLRPCKGILLFGPPGTGKTLLAKALATEAGANFISVTGSTLTSKWFGDAEKLTKALFSFASKLAPVIIFVDEVDSLLGARGGAFEHEATRRMRNEFMAAWDGLRTKDSQRILILGATNRPFDLDDAVIRRLPRRIYVDLPDAENRKKILRIFLAQESLVPDFKYDDLANATEGYSGSDLKNLCIAAAYRPVQELLEEEKKGDMDNVAHVLRSLSLADFLAAKAKVGASVAYDATSMNELRKWNEQYGEGGSRRKSPFGFGD